MSHPENTSESKTATKWVRETNWLELPTDITANILHRLGAVEILESAQKVCTSWRKICKDPAMWRVIDMHNSGRLTDMPYDLEKMCMHAVRRSQRQLVEINIEYFGNDLVMLLIAKSNSTSQLRCLRITCCYDYICGYWSKFFKKAPLLEEIALTHTDISDEAIADAGRYCPMLKSFKYNDTRSWSEWSDEERSVVERHADDTVRAITKSMSQLRHLQIIGNKMTNQGLQAIIDGCPQLEFLDLRRCFNINLDEGLIKLCKDRIKDLRLPDDSMEDFKFVYDNDDLMILDDDDDDDDSYYGELSDSDSAYEYVSDDDDDSYYGELSDSDSAYEYVSDDDDNDSYYGELSDSDSAYEYVSDEDMYIEAMDVEDSSDSD